MPDYSVQRRFPRYPIVLPVLYDVDGSALTKSGVGWTSNLSEGGACLELNERLDVSTCLILVLRTDEGEMELKAEVVWASGGDPAEGGIFHGVAFTDLTPDQRRSLNELIRTKGQVRSAGVRIPVELTVLCRRQGDAGAPLQGRTGDISRAGVLLRLPSAVPAGTVLEVTLQTSQGPLTAEGTIVWTGPPETQAPGDLIRHGFRFTSMDWSSELALSHLLAGKL